MPYRMPEGGVGLARESTARGVGNGAGDDQRQTLPALLEIRIDGVERGLGVEGVEDGLQQQDVRAAFHQSLHSRDISIRQFHKADIAETGPVDVRRDGSGAVGGAEHAGNETGLFRRGPCVGSLAGQDRAAPAQFMDVVLQFVIGHGDGG